MILLLLLFLQIKSDLQFTKIEIQSDFKKMIWLKQNEYDYLIKHDSCLAFYERVTQRAIHDKKWPEDYLTATYDALTKETSARVVALIFASTASLTR